MSIVSLVIAPTLAQFYKNHVNDNDAKPVEIKKELGNGAIKSKNTTTYNAGFAKIN